MDWLAWHEVEPRGDDRADQLAAFLASELPSIFGGTSSWKQKLFAIHEMRRPPLTAKQKAQRKKARKRALKKKMSQLGQAMKLVKEAKDKTKRGGE